MENSFMKPVVNRFTSALIFSLVSLSAACSQAKTEQNPGTKAESSIPAPLSDPLAVEARANDENVPYKAPPFCGKPADDTMNLYVEEPNGVLESYSDGAPIRYTAKNVQDFICNLLPVAIRMDRIVFKQRRYIEYLIENSSSLSDDQSEWLKQLKQSYGLPATATNDDLLERVDVVPIPLLLAQGALESAWGQSRFAEQGFNFFGIHGSLAKDGASGCMMSTGAAVCVRKYPNISAGVSDYLVFLNTEASQNALRKARQEARAQHGDIDVPLDSVTMAETMSKYSEIGQAYTNRVISVMNNYHLTDFAFDESLLPPLN
jgi:Bax protein